MQDKISIKGKLTIFNITKNKVDLVINNLVVNTGLSLIADRLNSNSINYLTHLAIGDDPTVASASDVILFNERYREIFTTTSTPGNVFRAETTLDGSEAVFTWREMGIFNDPTTGVLFNRVNPNYDHTTGDTVNVIFEITISA